MLKVFSFTYSNDFDELLANTYLIADDASNCIVIDPSKDNENLSNFILKNKYSIKGILLTHGHFDHFKGANVLIEKFNIPVFIHSDDYFMLSDSKANCSDWEKPCFINKNIVVISNESEIKLLNEPIKLIHTPYHTKGSLCFYLPKANKLFTGDLLFRSGIGRGDLPNNAAKLMYDSLNKVFSLPDKTRVFPGHGENTTIECERKLNKFVK